VSEDHKAGYREALLQGHNYEKLTWGSTTLTDAERHEVEAELGLREPEAKAPEPEPEAPKEAPKHAEKAARAKKATAKKPAKK
jgi:hypothetical protein